MRKLLTFLLLCLFFIPLGCSPVPSEEDIAASVDARVALILTESAPVATETPAPTHTPTPGSTTAPTATNPAMPTIDWAMAVSGPVESYFEPRYDEIDETTLFWPNVLTERIKDGKSSLALIVNRPDDGAPELQWLASYYGEDWIFMESVKVRVADTTYDLSDRFDYLDVNTNVLDGGKVNELVVFSFSLRDVGLLEALMENHQVTIRLQGSDGSEDLESRSDLAASWLAAIALFQSFGGEY